VLKNLGKYNGRGLFVFSINLGNKNSKKKIKKQKQNFFWEFSVWRIDSHIYKIFTLISLPGPAQCFMRHLPKLVKGDFFNI
jgi:hypothetical protein